METTIKATSKTSSVKPTKAEAEIIWKLLDKHGTPHDVIKHLIRKGLSPEDKIDVGNETIIFSRANGTYVIQGYKLVAGVLTITETSLHRKYVNNMFGHNTPWPTMVHIYFSDLDWVAKLHKIIGHCVELGSPL